jgi:hypothetical protein
MQTHNNTSSRASSKFAVTHNGLEVAFPNELVRLIGSQLKTHRLGGQQNSEISWQYSIEPECLLEPIQIEFDCINHVSGPCRTANMGMLAVAAHLAAKHNHDFSLVQLSHSTPRDLEPDYWQSEYPQLIDFLRCHRIGLIQSSEPAVAIAEALAAFYNVNIVVLANSIQRLKKCKSQIESLMRVEKCRRVVICTADQPFEYSPEADGYLPGVRFSTFGASHYADLTTADIVFLLDAAECCFDAAIDPLGQVDARFRLFGFVTSRRDYSPYELAIIARVFGFDKISLRRFGYIRRLCRTFWRPTKKVRGFNRAAGNADLMWGCVWRNDFRNDLIAKCAQQVADTNASPDQKGAKTAVVVDNLAQMVEISDRLPDWRLIINEAVPLDKTPGRFRTRIKTQSRGWQMHPGYLVAGAAAESFHTGKELDAVIVAGAGMSTSAIPDRWLYCRCSNYKPLGVVDFNDWGCRELNQMTNRRKRDYENRDIFSGATPDNIGRIERFLRQLKRRKSKLRQRGQI